MYLFMLHVTLLIGKLMSQFQEKVFAACAKKKLSYKKIIENSEFVSAGKIEGISNIVKIESVEVEYYDETGNSEGGVGTNVAIDKEGYAYDLSELGLNK